MTHYLHHVRGRLRVKSPSLKGQIGRAQLIKERLNSLPGVVSVAASSTTGSVIIKYEADQRCPESLLEALQREGVIGAGTVQLSKPEHDRQQSIVHRVGNTVARKLIESLIERSAVALVAALL